jgi:tetratricopeptide (TPR) repeat protein
MLSETEAEALAERAVRWFERAIAAREAGQLAVAEREIERAISGFSRAAGRDHPDTANARVERAQIRIARGEHARAMRDLDAAIASLLAVRGGGAPVAELAVNALLVASRALRETGQYAAARDRARTALRLATRRLPRVSPFTAAAHNELGMIGKYAGWFALADRHYRAARPLYRRIFGATSREMATLFHNLGGLEHARGEFARGEPLARAAVEIGRRVLPAGDPELLAHEVAHAALLDGLGRHAESTAIYRRALAAYTRRFGRVHYETASTLHNLAAAEHELGRLALAHRHYLESLRLHERLLGPSHPEVGLGLYNLGVLEQSLAPRDAPRRLRRALSIFRRRLGASHPHTRACAEALRT